MWSFSNLLLRVYSYIKSNPVCACKLWRTLLIHPPFLPSCFYSLEKRGNGNVGQDVECVPLHECVWGWPKGRSPNSCVLVPVSRHLVHSTHSAGTQFGERRPSPPLKSSVHPSVPSHCPRGSRQPQLKTDLLERAQVQQGVCPTAKCCASVSFRLTRGLCSSLSCFWAD